MAARVTNIGLERTKSMQIGDIMTPFIRSMYHEASLVQTAMHMKMHDIRSVYIVDRNRIRGMITDRDIVLDAVSAGLNAMSTRIGQVTCREPVSCRTDDTVNDAVLIMEENNTRRLLVLEPDGKPAGVVSIGDIATRIDNKSLAGRLLASLSTSQKLP